MTKTKRYVGIIEGFYGNAWSWEARKQYPQFMSDVDLNAYIYAPKSDTRLRSRWREPWSEADLDKLQRTAAEYKQAGIEFGLGLSPLGLSQLVAAHKGSRQWSNELAMLDDKLAQIDTISSDLLCILFDDMPSDGSAMAAAQLSICERICANSRAKRIIVCPSYYTNDPILEKLFGPRPCNYWSELGEGLAKEIDFFWTGEQVCSASYSEDNLQYISEQLRRPPVLWDNYPVNDGERLSRHLHLKPFYQQSFLSTLTVGHFANPMNQAFLSQLPLSTLAAQYEQGEVDLTKNRFGTSASVATDWACFIEQQLGASLASDLMDDVEQFQHHGLDNMSASVKLALIKKYRQYESIYAREIVDWLEEKYRFDPACLTG